MLLLFSTIVRLAIKIPQRRSLQKKFYHMRIACEYALYLINRLDASKLTSRVGNHWAYSLNHCELIILMIEAEK